MIAGNEICHVIILHLLSSILILIYRQDAKNWLGGITITNRFSVYSAKLYLSGACLFTYFVYYQNTCSPCKEMIFSFIFSFAQFVINNVVYDVEYQQ